VIAKHQPEDRQFVLSRDAGAPAPSEAPGAIPPYETWDACDLYDCARDMLIEGYAFMTKTELIHALRTH